MPRKSYTPRRGNRQVLYKSGKHNCSIKALAVPLFIGGVIGTLVIILGAIYPPSYDSVSSARYASRDQRMLTALNDRGITTNLISFDQVLQASAQGKSLLSNERLIADARAYQSGTCNSSCRDRLKTQAEASFGPNWREVAKRYVQR